MIGDVGSAPSGTSPTFIPYRSAAAFLEGVGPALEAGEDEHNLILGVAIARRAAAEAGFDEGPALFGEIRIDDRPSAAIMMTPPFPLVIAHLDAPVDVVAPAIAEVMKVIGLAFPGVLAEVSMAEAFAARWTALRVCTVESTVKERLHRADSVETVPIREGELIVAGPEHFPLLLDWMEAFHLEALPERIPHETARTIGLRIEQGDSYLWVEDGVPVGMAARTRATRNGICVNSVYTPPRHRGKGVATSCVATLTRRLLREAEFCVLFTDLANPTSNALYRRIGYRPIRDFDLHSFAESTF